MTRTFSAPNAPSGWTHPKLQLHRAWHARRVWQWRARAALVALTGLLIVVIALSLSPWWLALSLLPAVLPTPVRKGSSLRELEQLSPAYTTALTAPEDEFGFQSRLEAQALAAQRRTEPPALPWLELAAMAALCSLLLVFPPKTLSLDPAQRPVTQEQLEGNGSTPQNAGGNDAQPVLDAPSRGAAPAGGTAKPGQSASGGTPSESQVGDVKPGGGNASDDPAAVTKEYMDALERGAVRDAGGAQNPQKGDGKVQDNNPGAAGQQGSAGGDKNGNDASSGQNGSQGSGAKRNPSQGQKGQSGQQNQNGNGQNGQQQGNQNGQNGTQNGANSQSGNGKQSSSGNGQKRGSNGRGNMPSETDDPSGQGQGGGSQAQRSQPGRGGRGSSDPKPAEGVNGKPSKLEYLPGTVRGRDVRSGALQLPGDPRQPLTGTPGTPQYQRAAEGAILDPKLPPEYQELLKNYYK
jgi:hypothetical protein